MVVLNKRGSGILAIAAAKLGARSVLGVDIDEQAVTTARENARANSVEAVFSTADAPRPETAEVVVANILANPLIVLTPVITQLTLPGGRIALSGILADQFDDVAKAYEPWFAIGKPAYCEGWVRVTGVRRPEA